MIFGTTISPAMASGLKCNKKSGFTVYDEQNETCINPTENLKYKYWLDVNSLVCNKEAGYTKIKNNECNNPNTKLSYKISYDYDKEQKVYNEVYNFFYDGAYCGTNCDYDGKNCQKGFCNANNCAQNAGYTQIRKDECYNPNTKISYNSNGSFSKEYSYCGKNCDINGRNCKEGGCYPLKCPNGFQTKREYMSPNNPHVYYNPYVCYNPQTLISYTKNGIFIHDGFICGKNCDINGRNCKEGVCNIKDCKLPGYTKFSKSYCINPSTAFAYKYDIDSQKTNFYSLKKYIGYNGILDFNPSWSSKIRKATCNSNGTNCKTIKEPCTKSGGDCSKWDDIVFVSEFTFAIVGAVVAVPIMLPYEAIKAKIPDKQPDIKVNYLEKNRIK